jgi:hypothetical protein
MNAPIYTCLNCQDLRWVCESHEHRPWDPDGNQCCGGPGMPCPMCNPFDRENEPVWPSNWTPDAAMQEPKP